MDQPQRERCRSRHGPDDGDVNDRWQTMPVRYG
jgi:hypothetical protein